MKNNDAQNSKTKIEQLKRQVETVTGEKIIAFGSEEASSSLQEQFWENVLAFEQAPQIQLFETLVTGGLDLPSPDDLDDKQLNKKLWAVIQSMSLIGVFLYNTDHLSDRQLYELLWRDILREDYDIQPGDTNSAYHVDILGSYCEEDIIIFLKYYADETDREEWTSYIPPEKIPTPQNRPFDRDRLLPGRGDWTGGLC